MDKRQPLGPRSRRRRPPKVAMRLTRLQISNYARLGNFDHEIREHLVLVGANDVGKTSVLRALNLLLGSSVQQIYQALAVGDLADPGTPLLVRATLADFSADERAEFPDEIEIAADGSESLAIELLAEVSEDDPEALVVRRFFPESTGRAPSRQQLEIIGWNFLPATRSANAEFMEGKRSPLKSLLASTDLGSDKEELQTTLEAFNAKLGENVSLEELRSKIAEHLSRSMPKLIGTDDLTLRTSSDPTTDVLEDVTLFLSQGGSVKSLSEQSDGVRQLMTMTFFDLDKSAANIVAVDEPELHLHASSQRTVADLFARGSSQRLLVTHSPYVVQRFEPRHVIVVTANRDFRQIPQSSYSAVEKEQANWWAPNLLEALTARHVLLVEGAADRIIVEACARVRGINFDRLGVTVLELGGAEKFKHVNKLLGRSGFDLDLIGLVDKAESGPWIAGLGVKPGDVNVKKVFISTADLEDEYVLGMSPRRVVDALVTEGVCREKSVLQSAGVSSVGELTTSAVAAFVRDRKVIAAVAVGKHATLQSIARMPAINGLLTYVENL
jgi:putative ATP-dependent endonuclease of OLD family